MALEMETRLRSIGCVVLGPATSLEAANTLLDRERPSVALLDFDIRGRAVTPIARRLKAAEIPFALVTGLAASALQDPVLRDAPSLSKPITQADLEGMLRRLLDNAR